MTLLVDPATCYIPLPLKGFFAKPSQTLTLKEQEELAAHYFGRVVPLTSQKPIAPIYDREKRVRPKDQPKVVIPNPESVKFFIDFRVPRSDILKVIVSDERFKDTVARKNAQQVLDSELAAFNQTLFTSINSFHIFIDFVRCCVSQPSYQSYNLTIASVHKINRVYTVFNGVRTNVWARLQDTISGPCVFPRIKFRSFLKESDFEKQFASYLTTKEDSRFVR